jgi:hypothetical protein
VTCDHIIKEFHEKLAAAVAIPDSELRRLTMLTEKQAADIEKLIGIIDRDDNIDTAIRESCAKVVEPADMTTAELVAKAVAEALAAKDRVIELDESHRIDREKWDADEKRLRAAMFNEERDKKAAENGAAKWKEKAEEHAAELEKLEPWRRGFPLKVAGVSFVTGALFAALVILKVWRPFT